MKYAHFLVFFSIGVSLLACGKDDDDGGCSGMAAIHFCADEERVEQLNYLRDLVNDENLHGLNALDLDSFVIENDLGADSINWTHSGWNFTLRQNDTLIFENQMLKVKSESEWPHRFLLDDWGLSAKFIVFRPVSEQQYNIFTRSDSIEAGRFIFRFPSFSPTHKLTLVAIDQ